MKELWVEIGDTLSEEAKLTLIKAAKHAEATVIVEQADAAKQIKASGLRVASPSGGDIQLISNPDLVGVERKRRGGDKTPLCVKVTVRNRSDEELVVKAAEQGADYVAVECPDWKIIPLENLIAKIRGRSRLLAYALNPRDVKVALETLEIGSDGVILKPTKAEEITEAALLISKGREAEGGVGGRLGLAPAKIVALRQLGLGARVCVDTCDIMMPGEGMLLGCQSSGLFLVQAEVGENPHVEPRPFRVNAGPVSLYTLTPPNKTRYLSELKAGEEVLIADSQGHLRSAYVGRVKIERRPLTLVEAEVEGHRVKTIVQSAETIRFVTPKDSVAVTDLKVGDEVLVHTQSGGRHFGVLVKEEYVIER